MTRALRALAGLLAAALAAPPVYNVRSFGARGDGVANDTLAVQRAFDAASALRGACVVLFPAGAYLSWPLQLLGAVNATLQWAPGAALLAPPMGAWPAPALRPYGGAYVTVQGGSGVTLVGAGQDAAAINGSGREWWAAFRADSRVVRPQPLLNLVGVTDLVVRDLQVTLAPMFHIIVSHCQRALLEDVGVLSDAGSPNTVRRKRGARRVRTGRARAFEGGAHSPPPSFFPLGRHRPQFQLRRHHPARAHLKR